MRKFIQPVSIKYESKKQFDRLVLALEKLGYNVTCDYHTNDAYLMTNSDNNHNDLVSLGIRSATKRDRILVNNEDLFLAIAAMSEGSTCYEGEWVISDENRWFQVSKEVEANQDKLSEWFCNNCSSYDGRKATLEEIQKHFNTMQNQIGKMNTDTDRVIAFGYALMASDKLPEQKKFIGYKCPIDLFNGQVKKGDIFRNQTSSKLQWYDKNCAHGVAKEIVETWEKVYEDEYKEGDWVYVISGGDGVLGANNIIGTVCSREDAEKAHNKGYYGGEIFKTPASLYVKETNGKYIWGLCRGFKVRKAIKEEIEAVTIKLPEINGYEGKMEGGMVVYGYNCAKFSPRFLQELYGTFINLNEYAINSGGNRTIATIRLNSKVEISLEQLEQIINYLKTL